MLENVIIIPKRFERDWERFRRDIDSVGEIERDFVCVSVKPL